MILNFRQRRTYVDTLKSSPVLSVKSVMYNYSTGNSMGAVHFLWKISEDMSEELIMAGNLRVLQEIKPSLPVFHTHCMRKQFFDEMSLFNVARPAVLREMYKRLTGVFLWVTEA